MLIRSDKVVNSDIIDKGLKLSFINHEGKFTSNDQIQDLLTGML